MLTENLFDEILVDPSKAGADNLYVISGYASPAMVVQHFAALPDNINIRLIIGMVKKDGLFNMHHQAFVRLQTKTLEERFECHYLVTGLPVHTKVFIWTINDWPYRAYLGSANYTHPGMKSNREAMELTDANKAFEYFNNLLNDSVPCTDKRVSDLIALHNISPHIGPVSKQLGAKAKITQLDDTQSVKISFLDNKGNLPVRSGLNWGKRPEYHRNPNQAYIRVPSAVAKSGFFPPRGTYFTLVTDDGKTFDAVIAQADDKAIETPHDNSLLGKYFRERLNLPDGAEVKKYHLIEYGRHMLIFNKIDDETYYMDFSSEGK